MVPRHARAVGGAARRSAPSARRARARRGLRDRGVPALAARPGSFAAAAGVDIGSAAIELAGRRVPEADLRVGALRELPFANANVRARGEQRRAPARAGGRRAGQSSRAPACSRGRDAAPADERRAAGSGASARLARLRPAHPRRPPGDGRVRVRARDLRERHPVRVRTPARSRRRTRRRRVAMGSRRGSRRGSSPSSAAPLARRGELARPAGADAAVRPHLVLSRHPHGRSDEVRGARGLPRWW